MSKILQLLFFLVFAITADFKAQPLVLFEENRGQLPTQVAFKADVPGGALFIEKDKFTWHFSTSDAEGHYHGKHELHDDQVLKGHAFQMELLNANKNANIEESNKIAAYANYYIGKNASEWAKNVASFGQVELQDVYPNINWKVYSTSKNLKYDFKNLCGTISIPENPLTIQKNMRNEWA